MVESLSIARPYANAIFEIAVKENFIAEWEQILERLSLVFEDSQTKKILKNPKIPESVFNQFLIELLPEGILLEKPILKEQVANFIRLLSQKRRLSILPAIFSKFEQLVASQKQAIHFNIITPYKLDQKICNELLAVLQKKFHCSIAIDYEIDDSLIGGMVIRNKNENWVFDSSIKGKLQRLKNYLTSEI